MNRLLEWIYACLDRAWQLVSQKVFVRFEYDLPVDAIRSAVGTGDRLVFAVPHGGVIEWLILSSWCRSQGFGAILVSNRKRLLLLAKPKYFLQVLFGRRTYADLFLCDEPGPRLLVCPSRERKKVFTPTPVESLLAELQAAQAKGESPPFVLLTSFILWRRYIRGAPRRLTEYLFGLYSSPNLLGKLWYLAVRRMDSVVKGVAPFVLGSRYGADAQEWLDEGEAMKLAKSSRRRILVLHNQEMRVMLGPTYRPPIAVKESILRDPEIQALITDLSRKEGVDRRKLMARCYRDLTEIVANYSYRFIEVMYALLTWLFTKVFEGLETEEKDFHEVREVMKVKPVVFVSAHRSHLDYLVIPYVMFLKDMVTPHIAAGVNLAFWPIGGFLRRGGAFFIRRSFRGDVLYGLALKKYVEYLLANRYNIKFFIEGTRSRSGKLLAPAYGMLKMVMEVYLRGACDDIALVPVSITYDEVPEQGSYTKELVGGQKEKENAAALLKSRKITRRKFGKVYVRFSRPMFTRELLARGEVAPGADDVTLALQKTAFSLCKRINEVTPVTPKALVATILLSHRMSDLSLEDLLRLSLLLAEYVETSGYTLSVKRGEGLRRALEHTVRALQRAGTLNVSSGVPRTYFCENKKRIALAFYRNAGIHCLHSPGITVMAAFAAHREGLPGAPISVTALVEKAKELRDLLKFEFFFSPTARFAEEIRRDLAFLLGEEPGEAFTLDRLRGRFEEWNDLSIFLRIAGDIVESYLTTLEFLRDSGIKGGDTKGIPPKVLAYAEGRAQRGGIGFPESMSVQLYANALQLLGNRNLVELTKDGGKTLVRVPEWNLDLETLRQELSAHLDRINGDPEVLAHPEASRPVHD